VFLYPWGQLQRGCGIVDVVMQGVKQTELLGGRKHRLSLPLGFVVYCIEFMGSCSFDVFTGLNHSCQMFLEFYQTGKLGFVPDGESVIACCCCFLVMNYSFGLSITSCFSCIFFLSCACQE
jgi:hypothetical protein